MPHPTLDNRSAFFADALHLVDERFHPLLTVMVKGSFEILAGGTLALSAMQRPLDLSGRLEDPDTPERSSYRYEPEVAPFKLATDVVVLGHAHAPTAGTTRLDVGMRVGPLLRSLRVFGDRAWIHAARGLVLTSPIAFERMPLCYERAFGGWDVSHPDPTRHAFEPRNPAGRGFCSRWGKRDRILAPNLESIQEPIRSPYDRPGPVGFGFIAPHWLPRAKLAGTYDDAWRRQRCPLLPMDFQPRFHNAASSGLVAPGYLRGDEIVATVGLTPEGQLGFRLPGVPPPVVRVSLVRGADHRPPVNLDTIVVDLDDRVLTMTWRACLALPAGPHDVRAIEISCPASLFLPRCDDVTEPHHAAANDRVNGGLEP
jgi:hypothetical protein